MLKKTEQEYYFNNPSLLYNEQNIIGYRNHRSNDEALILLTKNINTLDKSFYYA